MNLLLLFWCARVSALNITALPRLNQQLGRHKMDQNVSGYIEKQKSPQKEILKKVRRIFLETLPNPEEKMGWGVVTFGGGKFYIAAMKSRVHVGFAITGLNEEEIICLREVAKQ